MNKIIVAICLFWIDYAFAQSNQSYCIDFNLSCYPKNLNTNDSIIFLSISIINNCTKRKYIFDKATFSTLGNSTFIVKITKNGKEKSFAQPTLWKQKRHDLCDYRGLNHGERLNYFYKIDITKLKNKDGTLVNDSDFGIYTISLIFKDQYLIRRKAVSFLKTNECYIEYSKK